MQKHVSKIVSCRLRAEASIAQAHFIAERCQKFRLVCPHTPSEDPYTGNITPCIHVFQEDVAKQEFGDTDWIEVYRPENSKYKNDPRQFVKLVGDLRSGRQDIGILVSYDKA